jgi:hypothetical protein
MVSPVHGDYRRCQAEIPLIVLCRFPGPALESLAGFAATFGCAELSRDFGLGKTIKIIWQQVWEQPYSRSGANDPKYDESAMAWITAVVAFLEPETIR